MPKFDNVDVVLAVLDDEKGGTFIDAPKPSAEAGLSIPGAVDLQWLWETSATPSLPDNIGTAPSGMAFPAPGGTKAGIFSFPANSAGKLDAGDNAQDDVQIHGEADMHSSSSLDFEFILSGQVDIVLPGGQSRTLKAGSLLIMAGAPHAWRNPYDEDCVYVGVIVGAHAPTESN